MKYIERIALRQYEYVEIHADSFDELIAASQQVKQSDVYKPHLYHKEGVTSQPGSPGGFDSAPQNMEAPMEDPTAQHHTNHQCATCGTNMIYKEGVGKTGRQWKAYMCPNSKKGQPGHDPQWLD